MLASARTEHLEEPDRDFADNDDAQRDGDADFDRVESCHEAVTELLAHKVVCGPVDAGTGNQWQHAAKYIYGGRPFSPDGKQP